MAVFSHIGILFVFLIVFFFSGITGRSKARKCERISPFFGGDVTYHDGRSTAFYSCEDAYSLYPSDIDYSNCTKHGNWKPKPPRCLRKAHIELPQHGYVCKGKKDIILHKETYAICCDRGYELYSDQYLGEKRANIRNNNGSLEPTIPECVEARCDPSDLYMATVQHMNGSKLTTFESRTHVLLSCKDGYGYYKYDSPMTTPLIRKCIKGKIKRAPKCKEAMCLFPGYPSSRNTYHRVYQADARFIMDGQYLEPQQQVEVFCHKKEHYELYVNSTETYLNEFISECRYGQFNHTMEEFPTCVERRCSFSISDEVCFWIDDKEYCESENFTIPSRSSVNMKCRDGYKLSWSEDGTLIEDYEDALIMCNRGVYALNYTCIPELCVVPSVKHAKLITNNASSYYHGEKITFVCNNGFNLHKKERFETICHLGKWNHTIPLECQPDLCSLLLYPELSIWLKSTLLTEDHGKIKTFENGTNLQIECKEGYTMKEMKYGQQIPSTRKNVTCLLGKWTRRYSCYAERCTAPMIIHARLLNIDERVYDHNETVTFLCDKGYHFYQNISTEVKTLETTCNFGQWSDTIPSACYPDGCKPDMLHGSTYYKDDIIVELGKETLVKHRTTIRMQCKNMFDLYDEYNNILRDKEYKPAVACYQGKWQNRHFCKKRCVTLNVTNGRLITDGRNVTKGETIAHGERVYIETNNTKPGSDLVKHLMFDSAIKCHDGEWHNLNGLSSSLAPAITTQIPATLSTDSTTLSESESENNSNGSVFPDMNQTHNTGNKGCTLSDDPRYTYKESGGFYKDPGSTITDGTTLTVACTTLDLNAFYASYDYDYYNHNTNNDSTSTITCRNNTLSKLNIDCPEVTPSTCLELKNGNVSEKNGYFIVSCDKGYSLDLIVPERPECNCVNGQLKSVYGRQTPACKPDKCVLPYEFHELLSVTDRSGVSFSGGSVVEAGDFVYFNCSKAAEPKYEPLNRRFQCQNGFWKEAERDPNWRFGNNGEFPNCREAICMPNCTNDGVCFKDDHCRCKHLFEGKRCEKSIGAGEQNRSEGVLPDSNKTNHNTQNKGCTLSYDPRYTYKDIEGLDKDPGSLISDGTTLTVTCTHLDLNSLYANYYYDYYNNDTYNDSTSTITCRNNTLSELYIDCPEETSSTCLDVEHGSVTEKNGYFIVSCDKGYSLDLIVPEKPQCYCLNGQLKSVYGRQTPACKPDKCVVPNEFHELLSVTYRSGVSLSGGSVVEVGDFVYFNCSKAAEPKYEPFNRRFQCENGLWKEAETDPNWKFGNNGEFPKCREAICEPNCRNDGVCFKDDHCRCKPLTEGKRCEKFICDSTCIENGGKCVGPGRCSCPTERVGPNCEHRCTLPSKVANHESDRTTFSPGETLNNFDCQRGYVLSSQNGMTCQRDGAWSRIVTCIKGCTLPSTVANHEGHKTTFSPGETLNNFNCQRGYVLSSQNGMTCQRDGSWSETVTCIKDHPKKCSYTPDDGHKWWPKWKEIEDDRRHFVKIQSRIKCIEECSTQTYISCKSVFYNEHYKSCWCLSVSDRSYFERKYEPWNSYVYILERSCK